MPQPQIHRHEKPPIPWTSISMSKKREAVQDNPSGRQLKHRRPPQPRQPPQARGHCTRYVAVHPLRGGAPEQKRCIAYGSGAAPQQTRTNAELAHRTTHRHTPPCAPGPYWRRDGHAAHATTCTPAHSDTSCTLKCEEPHIHRRLCHRILVGIPAQGASITSTTMRPWPCAITPQPGQPASWLHDSTSSTRAPGVRATLIRWKPSKPTSRSHRSQRSSDAQQQQVG